MKGIPSYLIVTISIESSERLLIFDKPLQEHFEREKAAEILLSIPNIRNDEKGRYSWGFTMDIIIYDREKAINCIQKALKLIPATAVDFKIYNEQNNALEQVQI